MKLIVQFCFLIAYDFIIVESLDNGLARTPPMGWMTWQRYRCNTDCNTFPDDCISENLIIKTANLMISGGWLNKGYEYVLIDDCWSSMERDNITNRLMADPKRFPNGIKWLSQFVHSLGLKFGIYLDFGYETCAGYPGSLRYLETDAQTMADWEIDYVKMDGCNSELTSQPNGYSRFANLLNATGRPITFLCSYPAYQPWTTNYGYLNWTLLQASCNLWRMLDDVQDSWKSVQEIITEYVLHGDQLSQISAPGHWNDPDMLLIGNYGLSRDQARVQMGMWVMFAAPLFLSTDLENIDDEFKELLQNPHLIRIDQDNLGKQATYIGRKGGIQIWKRKLFDFNDGWAISFLNPSDSTGGPLRLTTTLKIIGITENNASASFNLIDAFNGNNIGMIELTTPFQVDVNPSGIILLIAQRI